MRILRFPLLALGLGLVLIASRASAASVDLSVRVLNDRFQEPPRLATISPEGAPPADSLPNITRIYTHPLVPNDSTPTVLVLLGNYPFPCGAVHSATVIDPHHISVVLTSRPPCNDTGRSWFEGYNLGVLPAGPYRVQVDLGVIQDSVRTVYTGYFEFNVTGRDTTPPPPPPPIQGVPYVTLIRIMPHEFGVPSERPICPGDSILVLIDGQFPNECLDIREVHLVPSPIEGPPIVRLVVVDRTCEGQTCLQRPATWSTAALLPPLSAGTYELRLELLKRSCPNGQPTDSLFWGTSAFGVLDSCPKPPGTACLIGTFDHPNGPGQCDTFVAFNGSTELVFKVHSTTPLAGIQGELRLVPDLLKVTNLEPIGPARDMNLSWSPTPDGAFFVLFAPSGAPIPAAPWPDTPAIPILRVTVSAPPQIRGAPDVTHIQPIALLGSDENGQGVEWCPLRDPRVADFFSGRICLQRGCDLNGDGVVDVRDLVLMVRCLNGEGPCLDPTGAVFDCNRDSSFSLEDVICCARRVLLQGICPECVPDTTIVRPEPSVRLSLGSPVRTTAGVDVPVRLEGADRIGAAQFVLRYPIDRYEMAGVEFVSPAANWLNLYETRGADVAVGLVQMPSRSMIAEPLVRTLNMLVHLALKIGGEPGGEIQATQGDFSGPDGVKLRVDLGRPTQPLSGPLRLSLSASRPNPFSSATRFTLTLDQPADVQVGIYDLGGRLVAPLHRGRLAAGEREFTWNGTHAGGAPAENGIYFYRAVSKGITVSRKMILVRGN